FHGARSRIFSLTPRQMLLRARAERAAQLLTSNSPITDVAASVGYTDHSAFSRQFKALTGFTPLQYRQVTNA
ncbi:helix-turn-helix domain-containing protein, partial [Pseudomonas akapageensis]|uniref:helix-turn-helix domain-containing protein n=1 Tax=Pseudomonas akapageensis TaxID=2609961 RepID=UPI00140A38EC